MDRVPFDIELIIWRYVHNALYDEVMCDLEYITKELKTSIESMDYQDHRYLKIPKHFKYSHNICYHSNKWIVCLNLSTLYCSCGHEIIEPLIRTYDPHDPHDPREDEPQKSNIFNTIIEFAALTIFWVLIFELASVVLNK